MNTSPPRPTEPRTGGHVAASYPLFDWLRFALASLVVLDHAGFRLLPFVTGRLAVTVFFALSGWLIGGILLETSRSGLPRFFFNRATRIWIPYGLAIVLLYGAAALREGIGFFWAKYLVLDITFTHQLFTVFPAAAREMPLAGSGNQFWSIAVEEQFYLLAPLILLFLPGGRSPRLWAGIGVVAGLLDLHALPISLGVLAAIMQRRTGFAGSRHWRMAAAIGAITALAGLAAWPGNGLLAAAFGVATVVAAAGTGRRGAIGIAAGGLSFPLYLNHWIGVFIVHGVAKRWLEVSQPVFVVAQYLINIALAYGLYLVIDRNIQRYRDAWYSDRMGQRLGVAAYALVAIGLIAGPLMHWYGPHG